MPTQKLTNEIIAAAIDGYEVQKTRIDAKIAELRSLLAGGPTEPAATPEPPKRKRRKMSAAGRRMPKRNGKDGLRPRSRLKRPNRRSRNVNFQRQQRQNSLRI